jgi:iron complex transport system ATP-binding protein
MSTIALSRVSSSIADITVCRDLDLVLEPGTVVGMLGPNGVGKTTLLHTLAGLRRPDAGAVLLDGRPMDTIPRREAAMRLGLLTQHSVDPFPATVMETALIGRHPHLGPFQWEGREDLRLAMSALERVGLAGLRARDVHHLSGGERRRLAIATVITQGPSIYLLDEPLDQLDLKHQISVLQLCREFADAGSAVMLTLHEPDFAHRYCDRIVLLHGAGEVCQGTPGEILTEEALSRLYDTNVRRVISAGEVFFRAG